jgi:hypothetical protein
VPKMNRHSFDPFSSASQKTKESLVRNDGEGNAKPRYQFMVD